MSGIDGGPILVPGKNFPTRPSAKLLHAQALGRSLGDAVSAWRERLGAETTTELAPDGLSGVVRARLVESPPLEDWALLLGDVVHNYRASLDSLTWALAHLDGKTPREKVQRRIQFPFATSGTQWRKLIANELASLPAFAIGRLDRVQPYHAVPVEKGVGMTLHRLDIEDKHKGVLDLRLVAVDKTYFSAQFKMRDVLPEGVPPLGGDDEEWTWAAPGNELRDGDAVWEFRSKYPIEELLIDELPLSIQVSDQGEYLDLWDLMRHVDGQAVATFNIAYAGDDTEEHVRFMADRNVRRGTPAVRLPNVPEQVVAT